VIERAVISANNNALEQDTVRVKSKSSEIGKQQEWVRIAERHSKRLKVEYRGKSKPSNQTP
jgi:hypothetical protein